MTKRTALGKLCAQLRIPTAALEEATGTKRLSDERLLGVLGTLDSIFTEEAILIGGTTTHPALLGYRPMRSLGHNLDYIGGRQCVRDLKQEFHTLFYDPRDFVFLHYDTVRVRLALDHIYDWQVTDNFRTTARDAETERGRIHVAAPEYTIMLKLRKAGEQHETQQGRRGKDHLDIANLLLAPHYKVTISPINYPLLAQLCFAHVTTDLFKIGKLILETFAATKKTLNKEEFKTLYDPETSGHSTSNDIYTSLQDSISAKYLPHHLASISTQNFSLEKPTEN